MRDYPSRLLVPGYALFVVFSAALWPAVLSFDALPLARFGVCVQFVLGAALSLVGELRYVGGGPTVPALLALLIGVDLATFLLGLGFLILTFYGGSSPVTAVLLLIYAFFGGTGGAMLFKGVYTFWGAGRGWIMREALKYPWARTELEEKVEDVQKKVNDVHREIVGDEE